MSQKKKKGEGCGRRSKPTDRFAFVGGIRVEIWECSTHGEFWILPEAFTPEQMEINEIRSNKNA